MRNLFRCIAIVGVFLFAGGTGSHAQAPRDDHFEGLHFTGLINDVTTSNVGSWAIHGTWTLDMRQGAQTGDFTAALSMERSDLFFVTTPGADPNSLSTRNTHTHHISVTHGTVTPIDGGFRVSGAAGLTIITANGALAPFEPKPPMPLTSTLQIDVTGDGLVPFSNIALTFGGKAATHFGSNPIAGVVKTVR